MTYVTCRLTANNRDQLRNPTLDNRVWATFYLLLACLQLCISLHTYIHAGSHIKVLPEWHGPIGCRWSVSMTLSQTPAYAAWPQICGYCIVSCVCLCPSFCQLPGDSCLVTSVQTTCPESLCIRILAGARTRDFLIVSLTPYHCATTSHT